MTLVLSRKRDERIRIGKDISVTVFEIRGDKVRLGIDAPPDVSVHRQEVWDAIQRSNQMSQSMCEQTSQSTPLPATEQTPANPAFSEEFAKSQAELVALGREIENDPTAVGMMRGNPPRPLTNFEMLAILTASAEDRANRWRAERAKEQEKQQQKQQQNHQPEAA